MSVCKLVNPDGTYRTNATAKIFRHLEESLGRWFIGSTLAEVAKTHALSTRTSHIRQQLPDGDYYLGSERLARVKLERERRGIHWYYRLVKIEPPTEQGQLRFDV